MLSCRFLVLVLGITGSISRRAQGDAFKADILGWHDSAASGVESGAAVAATEEDFKCCKIEDGWFGHWTMYDEIRMGISSDSNTLCKQHIGNVYTQTCYEKDYRWPEHRIFTPALPAWKDYEFSTEMKKTQLRIEKFDTRPKTECEEDAVPWCGSIDFVTPRLSQGADGLEHRAVEANTTFTPKSCEGATSDATKLFECHLGRWKDAAIALEPKFQEEAKALKLQVQARRERARREADRMNRNGIRVGNPRSHLLPAAGGTYGQSALGRINTRATGIYHP